MPKMDNHAIIPLEHLIELEEASAKSPSAGERAAQTLQTTFVFGAAAGAITAGTWGYVKAHDWLEERRLQREMRKSQNRIAPK